MQLSIIIPMYNADQFIVKLLDSIYEQNDLGINFEVIIVDDVSTDNSISTVKNYIEKNKIVNLELVTSLTNGGTAKARNVGIEKAKGDWIQFVDSDDSIQANYFELISNKLAANVDCYIYGFKLFYTDQIITSSPKGTIDSRMIGFKNSVVNKIYRRQMVQEFNPSYKFEDVIWLIEVMGSKNWKCEVIDNLAYNVNRTNENSKMANLDQQQWKKMAIDAIKISRSLNATARCFVLETFVGTLFANIYTLNNRLKVALYALTINFKYLPKVFKDGIRDKETKEIELIRL